MLRRRSFVLWVALAAGTAPAILWSAPAAVADTPQQDDPQALLSEADRLKTVDRPRFEVALRRLDSMRSGLTLKQRWYLKYLDGWQADYRGNVDHALLLLREVIQQDVDITLSFRAMATSVNALDLSHRYGEAFTMLNRMVDMAPKVSDPAARFQGFYEAAQLLMSAGQFDLAASYADLMLSNIPPDETACKPLSLKAQAGYRSGELAGLQSLEQRAIEACDAAGESIFANSVRADLADKAIRRDEPNQALAILAAAYPQVQQTTYERQLALFDALMSRAYWRKGDLIRAEKQALKAIDEASGANYDIPLVAAYRVLYRLEDRRGDYRAAMGWLLKYTKADRDYLDDVHARALAYETVKQQAKIDRMQLDMQRALDRKAVEASRLYIALLLVVLVFVAFWLLRLKRSQVRFMLLAQRDGLTGILNHQFFVQRAEEALRHCRRQGRAAGLILLDLDHFKLINDTHGHAVGDQVLKLVVSRTQGQLRDGDIFGRLGGEEFSILLCDHSLGQTLLRAEAIREAIEAVSQMDGSTIVDLSASLGVADTDQSGHELRQLLADADLALYRAKRAGRNRVVAGAG